MGTHSIYIELIAVLVTAVPKDSNEAVARDGLVAIDRRICEHLGERVRHIAVTARTDSVISIIWAVTRDGFIAILGDRCHQNGDQFNINGVSPP